MNILNNLKEQQRQIELQTEAKRQKEAEDDGTTPDEVVNNRLLCLMLVHSLDEEKFNELRMVMQSKNNGELPS